MATLNRLVHLQWTPGKIKNYEHFKAIVKGWPEYSSMPDTEIEEAYQLITGKEAKKKKITSKIEE